ncbi:JAB domain-containing protein [Micromonospora thermarum]|uniref:DNA repair protein RadC n=1 Tax=Micromonospora thermarum TaxID=2720024 RepID=A0ABX0YYN5_9ACTN|nr:DNA repair protein RadC [Micromonospora thermarum]NJP30602.1 DNA repair protein RadC [Micromonospora thermarum]
MRIADLPVADRPRERLLSRGAEALSDRELLALLLGSGAEGCDAVELAGQLIARHGGLYELSRADAHELAVGLPGIGPAKAARVAAAFQLARRAAPVDRGGRQRIRGSADLAALAAPLLTGLRHERVVVIICDSAGVVLRTAILTEGVADRSLLPVRDVLALVLAAGGTAFGVAHNHPTGRVEPSEPDRLATARLAAGAEAVSLKFLDHVVVTDHEWRRVAHG